MPRRAGRYSGRSRWRRRSARRRRDRAREPGRGAGGAEVEQCRPERRPPNPPSRLGGQRDRVTAGCERVLICAPAPMQPAERVEDQDFGEGVAYARLIAAASASRSPASSQRAPPSGTNADSCSVNCRYQRSSRSRQSRKLARQLLEPLQIAELPGRQLDAVDRAAETISSPASRANASARSPSSSARSNWSRWEETTDSRSSAFVSRRCPRARVRSRALPRGIRRPRRRRTEGRGCQVR